MSRELLGALCLVLVIEGLVLFAAPRGWQATMREAVKLSPRALRLFGAAAIIIGLVALQLVH
ncbi:hypothetical protein SAMN04487785_103142 [Dyella jiangningensis]|uniref:DUF2065 domain-containing protein n=1 Tax=Dyella sp. AtDHG13 TaxID=1938897 RepID=UPI00087EB616|nr:DUF2065 domain-containing protein [Dyella sp. AtDHG13]PXV61695.1 hypothetical protein BDW41_101441 [Dyella sp. AtDHG13]SDJ66965.1 hypothetical protein SAMN04487785_103142 [Dyella jiangningensis]